MTSDPGAWIFFAAIIGAAIGVCACGLFVSRLIREVRAESYWEGYGACNREIAASSNQEKGIASPCFRTSATEDQILH
jgi:hypothetical protein